MKVAEQGIFSESKKKKKKETKIIWLNLYYSYLHYGKTFPFKPDIENYKLSWLMINDQRSVIMNELVWLYSYFTFWGGFDRLAAGSTDGCTVLLIEL